MCLIHSRFLKRIPLQRAGYFSSKYEKNGGYALVAWLGQKQQTGRPSAKPEEMTERSVWRYTSLLRCSGDRTGARRRSREVWLASSIRPPRSRTVRRRFVTYQLTWLLRAAVAFAAGAGVIRCQATALACVKWRPFSYPVFQLFFNSFTVLCYFYTITTCLVTLSIQRFCNLYQCRNIDVQRRKKVPERVTNDPATLFRGWHGTGETWFRMGPC
jgi:hypothetical protein